MSNKCFVKKLLIYILWSSVKYLKPIIYLRLSISFFLLPFRDSEKENVSKTLYSKCLNM